MRILLCFLVFSLNHSSIAYADILKCIGAEEAMIHKLRWGGAYRKLNQSIINELSMFSKTIIMPTQMYKKVCNPRVQKPSLELIKYVFLGNKLFLSSLSSKNSKHYAIDMASIESFKKQSQYIFLEYLASIQATLPHADCLKIEFPELAKFYTRAQYVLEDVGMNKLIQEIPGKNTIFSKLQSEKWRINCEALNKPAKAVKAPSTNN